MRVLPANILKCMSAADRKSLGKAGFTAEECLARAEVKNERALQKIIKTYLELKGIVVFDQRMDKKTRGKVGQPDFLFTVDSKAASNIIHRWHTYALAWEIKMPKGRVSIEQQQMGICLGTWPNGWFFKVIRSLDEAITELKRMGVT